jgi:uncharacterized radical SAM superfamily protein
MKVVVLGSIKVFIPGLKYPSISITGDYCSLMCDYCRAHYLRGMKKVLTPKELYDLVRMLYKKGINGVLVSGGFNTEGSLPIDPYIPVIKDIKKDFKIVVSVHTGLISRSLASKLRDAGVDIVDYELVIDDYVIKEVMHLKGKRGEDFLKTYDELVKYGPPYIVPHILVGANYGRVITEFKAIDILRDYNPPITVLLILKPTENTPMANVRTPTEEVIEVFKYTRKRLSSEIALGCMRPLEVKYTLDFKLTELGLIDRIVNPLKKFIDEFQVEIIETCCSLPNELIKNLS